MNNRHFTRAMQPAILVAALISSPLSARAAAEWQTLFDGRSLAGWKASENAASFKVVDGAIACDGPRAHLFYVGAGAEPAAFKNFEFSAEVRTVPGANSGIYFHTAFAEEGWPRTGFEVQVLNRPHGDGRYRENKLTGSLYGIRNQYKSLAPDNEWFAMRITVEGKRVRVWVREQLVVDYLEPADAPGKKIGRGTFALQCHDPSSRVFYRNLRARALPDNLPETAGPALTSYDREILRLGAANVPVVNYHVHLKGGLTLEEALAESRRTGVFSGIAFNCGLNFAITNDAGLEPVLRQMKGQPAFVAMQAEGREWVKMFSPQAVAQFDYVFSDAMTIFDDQGRRMRLWITNEVPEIKDREAFMDMLVDRTVKILNNEPINIMVNPTFLPASIAADYDRLWTEPRMRKVVDAAAARHVAIEINSRYRLPSLAFLRLAKAAGCKFTFGTNNADRNIGQLDYSFEMVKTLGLEWPDIWVPADKLKQ